MKIQKEKTVVRSYTAPKLSSFGKVAKLTLNRRNQSLDGHNGGEVVS